MQNYLPTDKIQFNNINKQSRLQMSGLTKIANHQPQQITQACCFVNTLLPDRSSTPSFLKEYSRSQSKTSKEKKIGLVIVNKGRSQEKAIGISLVKNKGSEGSKKRLKVNAEDTHAATAFGSKQTSKMQSLSTSRHVPEKILKIERPNDSNTGKSMQSYPLKSEVTFQQTRADASNLQMLSDITMVEEEFISHGSTTLNALNYLSNYQLERSKLNEQANNTIKLFSNYPMRQDTVIEFKNPLQKLADRRRGIEKKKLVL